jgi:cyanophycinase
MIPVFLIGGGWRAETFPQTYGRFLQVATRNGHRRIALIVAEEPEADSHAQFLRFRNAFESVGLDSGEACEIIVSAENPLSSKRINAVEPTGVFVCGGLTPAYHEALCLDKSWLELLTENEIPYCGFSAGASIAADNAIVGGWQREIDGETFEIANENVGEDLDLLDVRDGLGLVPFAVDVHATQWGTLSRLVHAVDANSAADGLAIDENTMLECFENRVSIYGAGSVYRVRRGGEENDLPVKIFRAGNYFSLRSCLKSPNQSKK